MQVTAAQVHELPQAEYILWDGEMLVRVIQHTGAYGFHSAAVIVDRVDSPLEVATADWYDSAYAGADNKAAGTLAMLTWIAGELTRLSTGTDMNLGGQGSVTGLVE